MSKKTNAFHRHSSRGSRGITRALWQRAVLWLSFLLLFAAFDSPVRAQEDRVAPLGLTPGSPAGSYALSDFDSVNLFNGSLNFRLPLLTIGGRGNAAHTIYLPIEQKWG